jgi:hypothetical protein
LAAGIQFKKLAQLVGEITVIWCPNRFKKWYNAKEEAMASASGFWWVVMTTFAAHLIKEI